MKDYLLSVCIPTYNRCEMVVKLVKQILSVDRGNLRVVVIDNNSNDDTVFKLKKIVDSRLFINENSEKISGSKNSIKALTVTGSSYNLLLIDRDFISVESIKYLMDFLDSNQGVEAGHISESNTYRNSVEKLSNTSEFIVNVFNYNLPTHPTGWFYSSELIKKLQSISEELLSLKSEDMMYPHVYMLSQFRLNNFIKIKYKNSDFEKIKIIEQDNIEKVKSGFINYSNEIVFVESDYIINEINHYKVTIDRLPLSTIGKNLIKLRLIQWALYRTTIVAKKVYNNVIFLEHYGAAQKKIRFIDLFDIYKSFYNNVVFISGIHMRFLVCILIINNLIDNTNPITYRIPRNPIRFVKKAYYKLFR